MLKKTIRHPKGTVVYTIYTVEEAKKAGIKFTSWKKAKVGEYSATDDGYVAICFKKYVYVKKNINIVRIVYPFGAYIYNEKNGKPVPTAKVVYQGKKLKKRIEERTHPLPIIPESKIGAFAIVYLATCNAAEAYMFVHPRASRPKARYWGRQCLLTPQISERIEKELTLLLEQRGIAKSSVPDLMQEALEMARDRKDCANFNRAVENIIKAHFPVEKTRKSFRIVRKSTQTGTFADIITEEDERLKEHGTGDNDILPRVSDIKSDDPDAVTKQTVDMSVVSERNTRLGESENIRYDPTDKEHWESKDKQDKTG